MKKEQVIYIIGGGLIGAIGLATTWYAGRKSYKQGLNDGWDNCVVMQNFTNEMQKFIGQKTES